MTGQINIDSTTEGILAYLTKNVPLDKRKNILEKILKKIAGKRDVRVTTAVALKPEEKQGIMEYLAKNQIENSEDVDWQTDKNIVAGIKIKIGDNLLDMSYEAILNKMQGEYYE